MAYKLPMYPSLPKMRCDKGCTQCCNVSGGTGAEYERIIEWAAQNNIKPIRQGIICPWYQNGTCAVYPVRPMICRLYGHVRFLDCPRGYNVNIKPKDEKRIMLQYIKDHDPPMVQRWLHEVVYDMESIRGFVASLGNKIPESMT